MNRIDLRIDQPRLVIQFRLFNGASVWLNVTRFEKGVILTRSKMLRERYQHTMLPDFRQNAERFDREVVALYAVEVI